MKNNLKQTIMLKIALKEASMPLDKCNIRINHDKGISYVNDIELPIIFTKSWFDIDNNLRRCKKEYNFYFNGFIGEGSVREALLKDFINRKDCKIIWSNDGRNVENKQKFNLEYFTGLAKSKYGLCPHQPDWPGDTNSLWTYRYIECLMTGTVPVNFKETPLSKQFISNTHFVWDSDVLEKDLIITDDML